MMASFGSRVKRRGLWAWWRASARYPKLAVLRRRLSAASAGSGRSRVVPPEGIVEDLNP